MKKINGREYRSYEEWKEIDDKVKSMVDHGYTVTKACEIIGVGVNTYLQREARKRKAAGEKQSEIAADLGILGCDVSQNCSVQLDGIALGIETLVSKIDKLIEIESALLDIWKPKEPQNNFKKSDAEKVERELGIRKFPDRHHI